MVAANKAGGIGRTAGKGCVVLAVKVILFRILSVEPPERDRL
jgi:hypothetical protein